MLFQMQCSEIQVTLKNGSFLFGHFNFTFSENPIYFWEIIFPQLYFFFYSFFFLLFFIFLILFNLTILYWFCHISKWICHRYTCVPHPEFWISIAGHERSANNWRISSKQRSSLQKKSGKDNVYRGQNALNWRYVIFLP